MHDNKKSCWFKDYLHKRFHGPTLQSDAIWAQVKVLFLENSIDIKITFDSQHILNLL